MPDTLHTGLLSELPELDHWRTGSGNASQKFGGGNLNESGDWSSYIPAFEKQSRPGFDTQGCTVFATLKAYITLARFHGFTDFPMDGSERYTGAWANIGPQGGNPHTVAEMVRKYGILPNASMPWYNEMTFADYYDKTIARYNMPLALELLKHFEPGHEWVIPWGSNYTPEEKADMIAAARKRGPVCVSISGNYRTKGGRLYKKDGEKDTHYVLLTKQDTIDDQYDPFIKKLVKNYDHDQAKVYFLKRRETPTGGFWDTVLKGFMSLWEASYAR